MTVPHDEQPLTRRALRELERQKPRKQQKEDAKAADDAEAQRRAVAEAVARASAPDAATAPDRAPVDHQPVLPPTAPSTPADSAPADSAPAAAAPAAAAPALGSRDETAASAVPFAPSAPATPSDAPVPSAATVAPDSSLTASSSTVTPALSRRARRALSADHPFADQQVSGSDQQAPDAPHFSARSAETASAAATANLATGPIIAEIMPDEPTPTDAIEVVETGSVEAQPADSASVGDNTAAGSADDDTSEVAVPVVEELIVIDGTVDPEVATQEDEEFAEIDDTVAPEAVHIITIDENPAGPLLPPLVQPPASREVSHADPASTSSSFDSLIASRSVGASNSVLSTSALVLPSVPNHGDVGTALDETGEVIITGSIDLPMSLGSTGAAPADGLESSELDAYLDPDGDVGSDVTPVSATRAVSTHGSNSGLIAPPKRSRANAPVILAVTAGVLAAAVIGLLVAAVFQVF